MLNFIKQLFKAKTKQVEVPSFLFLKDFKLKDNGYFSPINIPFFEEKIIDSEDKIEVFKKADEAKDIQIVKDLMDHILNNCATICLQQGVEEDLNKVQGMIIFKNLYESELDRLSELYKNIDVKEKFDKFKIINE